MPGWHAASAATLDPVVLVRSQRAPCLGLKPGLSGHQGPPEPHVWASDPRSTPLCCAPVGEALSLSVLQFSPLHVGVVITPLCGWLQGLATFRRGHGDHTQGSQTTMDDGAGGGGADCLPGPLSLPLHPGNSGLALVKQTCSLGLWEPVSPPGSGAIAVFLLGSQRARRGQVGPALEHGDMAVSVPCIIVHVYSG